MAFVCARNRRFATARLRHTGAELAYCDTGVRTSVRSWSGNDLTFLEFRIASSASFSFFKLDGEWAYATELDNTGIDYNNIQNNMSDSRRSPASTPRSGGRGRRR